MSHYTVFMALTNGVILARSQSTGRPVTTTGPAAVKAKETGGDWMEKPEMPPLLAASADKRARASGKRKC